MIWGSSRASDSNPGGGWIGLGARQSGSGYELLWRGPQSGSFAAWTLDAAGNRLSNRAVTLGEIRTLETEVGADIDGDGVTGVPGGGGGGGGSGGIGGSFNGFPAFTRGNWVYKNDYGETRATLSIKERLIELPWQFLGFTDLGPDGPRNLLEYVDMGDSGFAVKASGPYRYEEGNKTQYDSLWVTVRYLKGVDEIAVQINAPDGGLVEETYIRPQFTRA